MGICIKPSQAVNTHKHTHTSEQTYPEQWAAQEMPLGWGKGALPKGTLVLDAERRETVIYSLSPKHTFVGSENRTRDLLVSIPLL